MRREWSPTQRRSKKASGTEWFSFKRISCRHQFGTYFIPEEEFVPADEDLPQPLEDLSAVHHLMADQLFADEKQNLGTTGDNPISVQQRNQLQDVSQSLHNKDNDDQKPHTPVSTGQCHSSYLMSQNVSMGASGFHISMVSG